jgi:hypothetical protein
MMIMMILIKIFHTLTQPRARSTLYKYADDQKYNKRIQGILIMLPFMSMQLCSVIYFDLLHIGYYHNNKCDFIFKSLTTTKKANYRQALTNRV